MCVCVCERERDTAKLVDKILIWKLIVNFEVTDVGISLAAEIQHIGVRVEKWQHCARLYVYV